MRSICLVGMPAVGKSTVGKALSKRLQCPFIDSDRIISARWNRSIHQILTEFGSDRFLEIENDVLLSIDDVSPIVLSTGGSAILCNEGMQHIARFSRIVYLWDSLENIKRRMPNLQTRGIVGLPEDGGLSSVLKARDPLFRKWANDVVVLPDGFPSPPSLERVVTAII